jgi:acetylglutamate kinase
MLSNRKKIMSKPKDPTPEHPLPASYKAVAVFKIDTYLNQAIEITVVDGKIVSTTVLTEAPDVPANVVGKASKVLWKHLSDQ